MRAIVEISDKQFVVTQGDKLFVPLQKSEEGAEVTFDKVLLTSDENGAVVNPSAKVNAKVIRHLKAEKIMVFKKKRRKRYRRTKGHRQQLTEIEITSLSN
jgi:large subunit ribosomal protein L21